MRLSRKSDYALRALLHLCGTRDRAVPVRELADQNGIPRKFLETIMGELRARGLVESLPGKRGGYRLIEKPGNISIGSVLRHFDGRLENSPDDVLKEPEDPSVPTRRVRRVLRQIGDAVDGLMDQVTLEDVLCDRPIRYSITNEHEFTGGDGI
jgi:Rrf2 family protein